MEQKGPALKYKNVQRTLSEVYRRPLLTKVEINTLHISDTHLRVIKNDCYLAVRVGTY